MKRKTNEKQVKVQFNKCTESDFKTLGKALRKMRENRNLSQNDLSCMTLRDRTGISHYERGTSTPTLYALHDISEALNYDMEINFKEVSKLNSSIITEEFAKDFINQRKDQNTLANYIFSETDGVEDEWFVSEVNENDVTIKNSTNKYIRLSELDGFEGGQRRFRPIVIAAGIEDDGYCTWRLYVDSKEDGMSIMDATDLIEFVVHGYLIGNLISLNDALDDIFYKDIDILKLKGFLYESYEILKKYYKLTDDEILEVIIGLFGEDVENIFIGLLKSSYEPDISFNINREIILNQIKETLKSISISNEAINTIVSMGYCLEFSNLCFQLENEEGFPRLGEHICIKKGFNPEENELGNYVIETHILDFIDKYLDSIDDRYSVNEAIDTLCDILYKYFGEIAACEFEAYYDVYVTQRC